MRKDMARMRQSAVQATINQAEISGIGGKLTVNVVGIKWDVVVRPGAG